MDIVSIEAKTIPEAWFLAIKKIMEYGREYTIERGSYKGQKRKELDCLIIKIEYPSTRPLIPDIPPGMNIPKPVTEEYLIQYLPYLITSNKQEGEEYTYGYYLENQIEEVIKMYKRDGHNTNQGYMGIGERDSIYLSNPPCLRGIDTKIIDNRLYFFVYFRSWDLWCISEDSEILTLNGWKGINNISPIDNTATLNLKTWEIEYSSLLGINIIPYEGPMLKINNEIIDQLITPNHRVLYKYHKPITHSKSKKIISNWQYSEAQDLKLENGILIPIAAPYNKGNWSIGKDKVRLVGWILASSHYYKDHRVIKVFQSENNPKNIVEIRNLLQKFDIPYDEYRQVQLQERTHDEANSSKFHIFSFKPFCIEFIEKVIPDRKPNNKLLCLTQPERKILFDSMIEIDGSLKTEKNKVLSWIYYSKDKNEQEWFQLLALSLGYNAIVNCEKEYVQISKEQVSLVQKTYSDQNCLPMEHYKGYVWCVNTKQSNFIMRRNGKISITGNSGFPANVAAIQMLKEYMGAEIGVDDGELIAMTKGIHLYDFELELAKKRLYISS